MDDDDFKSHRKLDSIEAATQKMKDQVKAAKKEHQKTKSLKTKTKATTKRDADVGIDKIRRLSKEEADPLIEIMSQELVQEKIPKLGCLAQIYLFL